MWWRVYVRWVATRKRETIRTQSPEHFFVAGGNCIVLACIVEPVIRWPR